MGSRIKQLVAQKNQQLPIFNCLIINLLISIKKILRLINFYTDKSTGLKTIMKTINQSLFNNNQSQAQLKMFKEVEKWV